MRPLKVTQGNCKHQFCFGKSVISQSNRKWEQIKMLAITQSPICSYALNTWRFRSPSPEYDLAITFKPEGRLSGFETKSKARAEDICRVSSLLKLGGDHAMLGKWLGEATAERHLPLSCASSSYMRETRRRLLGAIYRHINDSGFTDSRIRAFTIINSRWFVPAGSLSACSAASIKAKFRRYLERALVIDADGLLFAGMHGSFDGTGYQLHFQGKHQCKPCNGCRFPDRSDWPAAMSP